MGVCTSCTCINTKVPDNVDKFTSKIGKLSVSMFEENDTVWRHELTSVEARIRFEKDGTVPVGCSDEMLELRMYISDPSLLRGLVAFAQKKRKAMGSVMILRRWVDMMSFKYVNAADLKVSIGYDIYFKYLDPTNAGVRRVFCEPQVLATIERELREAAAFNGKYGNGMAMRTEGTGILRTSLFDDIYFPDMETILNTIYLPLKASPKHQEAVTKFKSQYNQILVTDFEYMEALGHGGYGCVVHCKKKSTGVHYAMKIQTKDGVIHHCAGDTSRVTIEKEALVLCNHPFITNLVYSFQNEQLIMMVMTLAGGSLADFADEFPGGVLAEEYVVFYTAEVLLALNHIHHLGMIYRDMKPHNVLLMEDGHVKLADLGGVVDVGNVVSGYHTQAHDGLFGAPTAGPRDADINSSSMLNFSKSHSHQSGSSGESHSKENSQAVSASENSQNTSNIDINNSSRNNKSFARYKVADAPTAKDIKRAYTYFGTSGYVAPEVIRTMVKPGESPTNSEGYTHAVDFFSLGVTMYKLLTGEFPFEFRTNQMENYARSFNYRPFPVQADGSYAVSVDCRDLMEKLLVGEEKKRLGYGRSGCSKIKKHPLFKNISWLLLTQKQLTPPVIPERLLRNMREGGHLSRSNGAAGLFDGFYQMLIAMGHTNWLTRSLITAEEQVHFRSWDFVSGEALGLEIMNMQDRERERERDGELELDAHHTSWGRGRGGGSGSGGGILWSLRRAVLGSTAAIAPTTTEPGTINSPASNSLSSFNHSVREADSYITSVHMVDTAASMLRTMEADHQLVVLSDNLEEEEEEEEEEEMEEKREEKNQEKPREKEARKEMEEKREEKREEKNQEKPVEKEAPKEVEEKREAKTQEEPVEKEAPKEVEEKKEEKKEEKNQEEPVEKEAPKEMEGNEVMNAKVDSEVVISGCGKGSVSSDNEKSDSGDGSSD